MVSTRSTTKKQTAAREIRSAISILDPALIVASTGPCALLFVALHSCRVSALTICCLLCFTLSTYGELLSAKVTPTDHRRHQYFGLVVFLTVDTNVINIIYFSTVALAPCVSPPFGSQLDAIASALWPVAFALGLQLTPLYYLLAHSNPAKIAMSEWKAAHGFRFHPLADHVCHAPATPLSLLYASTLGAQHATTPAVAIMATATFVTFFLSMTLLNRRLTGMWTYPVIEDVEAKAGTMGVVMLFTAVLGAFVALALAGLALISFR